MSSHPLKTAIAVLVILGAACSSNSGDFAGTGGGAEPGSGGTSSGGAASGGVVGSGSNLGLGGHTTAGGASATSGSTAMGTTTGGNTTTGGVSGTGGASTTGGMTSAAGTSTVGGSAGSGGAMGAGGFGGAAGGQTGFGGRGSGGRSSGGGTTAGGGMDGGSNSGGGSDPGTGGATGTFDPCPSSGACKILPLGDSITWGVNYDGGYRVKLYANSITDSRNITYVGKLSNGPDTVSGVTFPKNNEGHSGWTIQQIDDIVTGKSTDTNYSGKKLMADLAPNIILLHAGTNDMARGPSGAPDRLGTLIDHILADAPDALLVVTTIIPVLQAAYTSATETYNEAVPGVVQKRSATNDHVVFIDMFASFPTSGMSGDGVHPNQQGYDWMAGAWYDAIETFIH